METLLILSFFAKLATVLALYGLFGWSLSSLAINDAALQCYLKSGRSIFG